MRAVLSYNPLVYGKPGTAAELNRLKRGIDDYDAQDGGRWNYDSLFSTVISVLKGMTIEHALEHLSNMPGNGEAEAKTKLFKHLIEGLPLSEVEFVEVGATEIKMGENEFAKIRPDFCYKLQESIYWVFVYPNKHPPLKEIQRVSIARVLARPLPLSTERHILRLAEYPELSGKRVFRCDEFECEYKEENIGFKTHLADFYRILASRGTTGDFFE